SSDRPGPSVTPSSAATDWLMKPWRTGTRSANAAPDGYAGAASSAALDASLVLPTPPGPTRLTTELPFSAVSTAVSWLSRPTKLVRVAGRPATTPACRPAPSGDSMPTAG